MNLLDERASIRERKDVIKSESLVLLSNYNLTNIATEMSEARLSWMTMGHRGIHRGCSNMSSHQTWRAGGGGTRYRSGG